MKVRFKKINWEIERGRKRYRQCTAEQGKGMNQRMEKEEEGRRETGDRGEMDVERLMGLLEKARKELPAETKKKRKWNMTKESEDLLKERGRFRPQRYSIALQSVREGRTYPYYICISVLIFARDIFTCLHF
jgi:hypothetical protein